MRCRRDLPVCHREVVALAITRVPWQLEELQMKPARVLKTSVFVGLIGAGAVAIALAASGHLSQASRAGIDVAGDPSSAMAVPEGQRQYIEDGVVDWLDYERASAEYESCLQGHGARIVSKTITPDRRIDVAFSFSDLDNAAVSQIVGSCYDQELSVVDSLWAQYRAPSDAELSSARLLIASCLRAKGYAFVPENPARGELVAYWPTSDVRVSFEDFGGCQVEVERAFGLTGFGG